MLAPLMCRALGGSERAVCGIISGRDLNPDEFLRGITQGYYLCTLNDKPMWTSPRQRAVVPIEGYKVHKDVKRYHRQERFQITRNQAFEEVLQNCADSRQSTWITSDIMDLYRDLFEMRIAFSVEAWKDGELAGGLFGYRINGLIATKSLFYRKPNASKVAFYDHLLAIQQENISVHDVQMLTPLTTSFGAGLINREEYHSSLMKALIQLPQPKPAEQVESAVSCNV